jgi:hypothetical protein
MSTTGDTLNAAQQTASEKFIRSGKGYVGIHAAADGEYDWRWYDGPLDSRSSDPLEPD